ncbi:MAG: S8 family serine peptidase, partial [bacterium]
IEGNWIETHEDLHGGTDSWHIAGTRINDEGWWNHGTAVLGEIASDSNSFGMTGIAYNVDLGTVSIGSMSTAAALTTATNNTVAGDIILIELHAPGPHYNFESRPDQAGYVAMEYWQENFDVILQASALGRIIVEAGGNGAENFDDAGIYGLVFDSSFRFSGAIMVAASDGGHYPASFTNYGSRLDVHAFGTWNVYTLGYGDLYGSGNNNNYTATFAGTSSASPIIVGACAVLQGIQKAAHGWPLDHTAMRSLLKDYSTPQAASPKPIGPLPDLEGSTNAIIGVSFVADTTFGWAPLDVTFSASSALSIDSWTWDFGDGDSAFIQNPSHTYGDRGVFDVTLEVDAGGDIRTTSRAGYIVALADTLRGDSIPAVPGEIVEVLIYATNTVPLKEITIPIEYGGVLDLDPTGVIWSTAGYRSDPMDQKQMVQFNPSSKQMVIRLTNTGSSVDLPPGDGPIVSLFFELGTPPSFGQATDIALDGYAGYLPSFSTATTAYSPIAAAGNVSYLSCCQGIRGNIDGDPLETIDITDLVYLVNYMFNGGPEPPCMKEANVDGDIFENLDIADLVYLVTYMFSGGPAPALCF